jgi:hypothetical protein
VTNNSTNVNPSVFRILALSPPQDIQPTPQIKRELSAKPPVSGAVEEMAFAVILSAAKNLLFRKS